MLFIALIGGGMISKTLRIKYVLEFILISRLYIVLIDDRDWKHTFLVSVTDKKMNAFNIVCSKV